MRRRPRRYRRTGLVRRRRRNWGPFIIFVLVLGLFLWALFQFFSLLFSNVRTEISSAQLEILQGRGEFRLSSESRNWTPAFSGQNFVEGDELQTAKNAHFRLTFFEDHDLFLGENTELELLKLEKKSSGQFTAHWQLNRGQLWANVDSTQWSGSDETPDIKIYTPRSLVNITGTRFNLEVSPESETLKLLKGGVQLDLLNQAREVENRVAVSVGQQITLDDTASNLAEPASLLEIIEPEFSESDWHLKNLEKFEPDNVATVREKIKARNQPAVIQPTESELAETPPDSEIPVNPELEAPAILSPAQNAVIPAAQSSIAIEGTAPNNAFQIQVNGYTLSKFQPGDRKWTYFAATKFGTLKSGSNTYQVLAIDRQGQRSKITTLNLTYEGVVAVVEEAPSVEETLAEFPPPVVTTPPLFTQDPNATYQTSADRVTLFGSVPVGTNAVKVNGFQLRKFKPGDTKFQYTAIALGINGNMQEGENTYNIQALGPDGKSSQTSAKVFYTPLSLDQ